MISLIYNADIIYPLNVCSPLKIKNLLNRILIKSFVKLIRYQLGYDYIKTLNGETNILKFINLIRIKLFATHGRSFWT